LNICKEPIWINDDSRILKATIRGNSSIWLASISIPKKSKKWLLEIFNEIKNRIPTHEWPNLLLGGDWNVNLNEPDDKIRQSLYLIVK